MMAPDVIYDALLANERSLDDPQIIDVEPGETVAIRWIAGGAFMNYFLDLGELEAELLRTDANPVEPIKGSVFQLALAQRLTLRVTMPETPGCFLCWHWGNAAICAVAWCCAVIPSSASATWRHKRISGPGLLISRRTGNSVHNVLLQCVLPITPFLLL